MKWAATYDKGGLISEDTFHFCSILKKMCEITILNLLLKGQLISKCSFGTCHQIDQKTNEIFVRISALASKGEIKKLSEIHTSNWMILF